MKNVTSMPYVPMDTADANMVTMVMDINAKRASIIDFVASTSFSLKKVLLFFFRYVYRGHEMSFSFIFPLDEEEAGCEGCSPFARCQNGLCICLERYAGNGYDCHREWFHILDIMRMGKVGGQEAGGRGQGGGGMRLSRRQVVGV